MFNSYFVFRNTMTKTMTKTITIGIIALAFVAGSIMTGTPANAGTHDDGGNEFLALLMQLETQIISMQTQIQQLQLLPGPQGDPGPQGPQGSQGSQGPEGEITPIIVRKESTVVPKGTFEGIEVECEEGEVATGGGFINGAVGVQGIVISNHPIPNADGIEPTGWRAAVGAPDDSNLAFAVFVICAEE